MAEIFLLKFIIFLNSQQKINKINKSNQSLK